MHNGQPRHIFAPQNRAADRMTRSKPLWFGQNFRHSQNEEVEELPLSNQPLTLISLLSRLKSQAKLLIPEQTEDPEYYFNPDYHSGLTAQYLEFTSYARYIVNTEIFNYAILLVIIIAGVNIGVQSYHQLADSEPLLILDTLILVIFSLEAILKILAEGIAPYMYWIGPEWKWNNFDFTIVFLSLPFWNGLFGGGSLALLRLVRLMRLAKLIKKIPQLQMIVQGLTGGLSSIGYIMILLSLVFYLFAIAGVLFFRGNDPFHFGSLPKALVTCFVCATLDSWSTVMFINNYGCDKYPDVYSTFEDMNVTTKSKLLVCDEPKAQYIASTSYFILLVVMTALVMLSLFIGAVTLSMQDSLDELKEIATEKKKQERIKKQLAKMFQSQKNTRGSIMQVARRVSMKFSSLKVGSRPDSPESFGSYQSSAKYNPIRQIPKLPEFIPEHEDDPNSSSFSPMTPGGSPKPGVELVNYVFTQPSNKSVEVSSTKLSGKSSEDSSNSSEKGGAPLTRKASSLRNGQSSKSGEKGGAPLMRKASSLRKSKSTKATDILSAEKLRQLAEESASGQSEESKELGRKLRIALGDLSPSIQDEPKTLKLFISRLTHCQSGNETMLLLAEHSKFIAEHPYFVNLVTTVIILAGINVGAQTDPRITELPDVSGFLRILDIIILTVFTIECILKIFGEVPKPWVYFRDHWNKFDFLIVIGSYTPGVGSLLTILRLLRLLRVLKLVKSLPQLAVIVSALVMGLESIAYIALILFLCFYVFAILGMMLFRANDPFNFGNLHMSMFTLFRCSTLDAWADVMYINIYGCDMYPGGTYSSYPELCTSPQPQGFFAVVYFVCFIIIGAQILLTLFIGVVTTSMEEAQVKQARERKVERQLTALKVSLDLSDIQLTMFKDAFNMLDLDQGGLIEVEEIQIGLGAIKELAAGSNVLQEIEKADPNNNGIDLVSFIVVLSNIPIVRQKTVLRKTVKRWLANKRKRGVFFREPRKRTSKQAELTKQWIRDTWSYLFGKSTNSAKIPQSSSDSLLNNESMEQLPLVKVPSLQKISSSGSSDSKPLKSPHLVRHASTTWLPQSKRELNPAISSFSDNLKEVELKTPKGGAKYKKLSSSEINESPTFVRDFHEDNDGLEEK